MRSTIVFTTLLSVTTTVFASPAPAVQVVQVRQVQRDLDLDLNSLLSDATGLLSDLPSVPTSLPTLSGLPSLPTNLPTLSDLPRLPTNLPTLSRLPSLPTSIPAACTSLPFDVDTVPTPTGNLVSALATITNTCSATITGQVGSEYTSYTNAVSSWYSDNSAKLAQWLSTDCPMASSLGLGAVLPSTLDACGTGATSAGATSTGASQTAGEQGTVASAGAAPRQTAFAAAAGLFAGLVAAAV
ncbi:hypothetical protein K504DRAFT_465658 [Pleomassaria siparia CBS 279.74]|uniref:Infection structure specific protein n=1 Tax=Pleomassaria siparia CBS 279.74 TaxID=1314801 RepID=A0A6G1KGH9_9PLEO|nr:hypothetical protein K504DRAFT_465658 [Pleomassaria siparia CBS 279.74]